jgi:hypothetical protein
MATRSAILIREDKKGTAPVTGIYCHSDGYISNNGTILFRNYSCKDKLRELMADGDYSYLDDTYESSRSYKRWRGEHCPAKKGNSVRAVADKLGHDGYVYLYDVDVTGNGTWFVSDNYGSSFKLLERCLVANAS